MTWVAVKKSVGGGPDPYRIPYDINGFSIIANPAVNNGATYDTDLPLPFLWRNQTGYPVKIVCAQIDYRIGAGSWTPIHNQYGLNNESTCIEQTGYQANYAPLSINGGPPFGDGTYIGEYLLHKLVLHFRWDTQSQNSPLFNMGIRLSDNEAFTSHMLVLCEAHVYEANLTVPFNFAFVAPPQD